MAAPSNVTALATGQAGSDVARLVTQVNNLTLALRQLTAKLDADAGVTDTNYDALITASGGTTPPAKIDVTYG